MDHDDARRLMAEAFEGRLLETDERDLAVHLVGCPECKSIYEGLQIAQPALAALRGGPPSSESVDDAVRRATTVLRGDADPGPVGRSATEFGHDVRPQAVIPTIQQQGPLLDNVPAGRTPSPSDLWTVRPEPPPVLADDVAVPIKPAEPVQPIQEGAEPEVEPEAESEAEPHPTWVLEPEPPVRQEHAPVLPELPPEVPAQPVEPVAPIAPVAEPPAESEPVSSDVTLLGPLPPVEPVLPSVVTERPPPPPPPPPVTQSAPPKSDEIEELFEQEYLEQRPPVEEAVPPGAPPRRPGAAPWLAAIAITIGLAVLAGILITRGQIIGGGGGVPSAAEVRSRLDRVFDGMDSLKATFKIRKLSLYRVGARTGSLVYSFSEGTYDGRTVYDKAEGGREDASLTVRNRSVDRTSVVRTTKETRSLIGSGGKAKLTIQKRPPLGPPDGSLNQRLGLLEQSVGTAVDLLAGARDLEVLGRTTRDGQDYYEVRAQVDADEYSRADLIEALLSARTFFPSYIRRSISRGNARALASDEVLSDAAISTAFGSRDRLTTELDELSDVVIDDVILPGDLMLDVPSGASKQTVDASFERATRADIDSKLKAFKPLFPTYLPSGYEEQSLAVSTGKPGKWGPNGAYPAPNGIMNATYFNGRTTIAITERNIPSGSFPISASPVRGSGLPISVQTFDRQEKTIYYGSSPEVVPHAYAFLGRVFVMVSGYAPSGELVRIAASLSEGQGDAAATPAPETSAPSETSSAATPSTPGRELPGD